MKTVVVIDYEEDARKLLKYYILQHSDLSIIGGASNEIDAVKLINHFKPDKIFLDIQMSGINGFETERLSLVRDIFLFSCFTVLIYIDVKNLTKSHINFGIDGVKWIFTHRQKTESASKIPILPVKQIKINKYGNNPQCLIEDKLLPILSNQKMNANLKEITGICEIEKELTFHIARHTFTTTVTLANGVPIKIVSKMLGHKNLRTTQHYAKVLDRKVSDNMKFFKIK